MCGITGKVRLAAGERVTAPLIERMVATLHHRGPDERGVLVSPDGRAGIGASRLSIIDLAGGHQPMSSPDGAVFVVLNGEIYNHRELRERLAGRYPFRTHCDTEVLLPLYEAYGDDLVEHLRGMFAFAIWDGRRGRLLLGRDRVGKKPLYVAFEPQTKTLSFGSEIKALLADASVSREIDPVALDEYLTHGFIPAPRSIYRVIRKLPQAHVGVLDENGWRIRPYWQLECGAAQPVDEAAAVDQLDELLTDAVRTRLISDVPLGVFLSGGVDSAIITAIMSKLLPEPAQSFTIGFPERQFCELEAARRTALHCRTLHTELVVDWNVQELVPLLARHFDEPFADSSAVPTYHVSQMARRNITVALTGDGGDELLAGYNRYQAAKLAGAYHRLPRLLRPALLESAVLGLPISATYFGASLLKRLQYFLEFARGQRRRGWQSWLLYFDDDSRAALYTPAARDRLLDARRSAPGREHPSGSSIEDAVERSRGLGPVERLMWIDFKTYLCDDILVKVDRMSMAVSLECRAPLLDHRLIEWLSTVPIDLKLRGLTRKYLLRRLAERYFPQGFFNRPKQGFMIPLAVWLKGPLGDWLVGRLADNPSFCGTFDIARVHALLDEHRRKRNDHSYRLWALLMAGEFLRG